MSSSLYELILQSTVRLFFMQRSIYKRSGSLKSIRLFCIHIFIIQFKAVKFSNYCIFYAMTQ